MEHVFFKPWVGAEYSHGGIFGKRILVLGESHYTDGEPDPNLTNTVMNEYLSYETTVPPYLQSFNKFERSLVGTATDGAIRKRIWNSLVFYNYLQTPMQGPRQAGSKADYANAAESFFEVLEEYRPEYVIVWGYRLWDALPGDRWEWGDELTLDGAPVRTGCYLLADGTRINAVPVKHPSAGYTWEDWYKDLQPFLKFGEVASAKETQADVTPDTTDKKVQCSVVNSDNHDCKMHEDIEDRDFPDILQHAVHTDIPTKIVRNLYGRNRISGIIEETYSTDFDSEQIIHQIKKALHNANCDDDETGYKRTFDIMDKICSNVQLQHGQMLISLYLNTYCKRNKQIKTRILNEPAEHTFTNAPENTDYITDIPNTPELFEHGVTDDCIFSIENKERANEPYILCQACNGSGKKKCPSCKGSGREQYVDGYFASREERIKTGACSTCCGSGKVDCQECNGTGRIEIFSPNYSVIKSVSENISQVAMCAYSTPWNGDLAYSDPRYDIYLSKEIQQIMDNGDFIRVLMKNCKTTAIDNTRQFVRTIENSGAIDLYNENATMAKTRLDKFKRGDLVCQRERHYLLPVSRVTMNISDRSVSAYLLPYNRKSTIALLNYYELEETGMLKYLFYKLFK